MRKIIFEVTLDNDDWTDAKFEDQEDVLVEVSGEDLKLFVEEQMARQKILPKGCYINYLSYSVKN